MDSVTEPATKKRILCSDRNTHHPGIRKRPRYLTSWEESFRRGLPQTDEHEPRSLLLPKNTFHKNGFGLNDLFGRHRWVRPKETKGTKGRLPNSSIHRTASYKPSECFTLRMEHRTGGTLAKHAGEERILLFRSDRAGAIAKIVFSSSPVRRDDCLSTTKHRHCQQQQSTEKRQISIRANAKIHVLFVKDAFRGYNLGGLLFSLCTASLRERYSSYREISSNEISSICCQLDAEEDVRRHDKLVHFYEHLGLRKRKRTKATFINNNDGENYRRIPMKIELLLVPSCCKQNTQQSSCYESRLAKAYFSFLPAFLVSSTGECAKVENIPIDSWLIVECQGDGTIELRTIDGRSLKQDDQGRCKLAPTQSHSSRSGGFQLLRVSDILDKVLWNKDEDCSIEFRDKALQEEQKNYELGKEKELWVLRSPLHGTFLKLTSDCNLVVSIEASFWQADENFCLAHTNDSPARRQHHRRMWKTQSVDYVSTMREKYSAFELCTMSIREALDLAQNLSANPFSISARERTYIDSHLPSVRTLLFYTAELARKEGHPDWVQFVALIHGLASALACANLNRSSASTAVTNHEGKDDRDSDFDWTIYVDARVMGCKTSKQSTFHEFRHLNPDKDNPRYNTTSGLYREHVGLENVLLSWTSGEYMYHMLEHNEVRLPSEAYTILKLFPLVDWHKRGNHISLSNEADEDVKPFVTDFHNLFERSRDAVMNSSGGEEMSETECRELWANHYSLIANKYGAGGILEW